MDTVTSCAVGFRNRAQKLGSTQIQSLTLKTKSQTFFFTLKDLFLLTH